MRKTKSVSVRVHTRALDRLVAHNRMKQVGMRHVNKHDHYGNLWERTRTDSYFALNWRDWVDGIPGKKVVVGN